MLLNAKQLKAALAIVSKAVATKPAMPILGNVKVAAQSAGVSLTTANLEMTIQAFVPSGSFLGDNPWATTVPAQPFFQLVAGSESEIGLEYAPEGETLTVKSGKSKAALKGVPAEQFPPLPLTKVDVGKVNAAALKRAIRRVVMAASKDNSRPALESVQLLFKDGHLYITATDGFRLASHRLNDVGLTLPSNTSLLIPSSTANKLADILPDCDAVTLRVNEHKSAIQFAWEGVNVWTSLLSYQYPDWEYIVPKLFRDTVSLSFHEIMPAIRRAEIFARESDYVATFLPSDNGILVFARDKKGGKSETFLNVNPPRDKVSMNVVFVRQAIEAVGEASIKMCINKKDAPVLFAGGDDDYLHLIMPTVSDEDISKAAVVAAAATASEV